MPSDPSSQGKHRPTVSIGMPVFNGGKFIREALDSLLAQSHTQFELIISDNASTDDTSSICEAYSRRDPRIRYFRQPENLGVLANFKFVLKQAQTDYFMWAAADDAWNSHWISELLNAIKNKNTQAAFGRIQCIDEHSEKLNHYANGSTFEFRGTPLVRQLKYFLDFEGAGKANPIYGLWPTEFLRSIDLETYQHDYLIVFDLLKDASLAGCHDAVIFKRFHTSSEGEKNGRTASSAAKMRVWRQIVQIVVPFPSGLISAYYRSGEHAKPAFIAVTPFKFLFAYWFKIRNRFRSRSNNQRT